MRASGVALASLFLLISMPAPGWGWQPAWASSCSAAPEPAGAPASALAGVPGPEPAGPMAPASAGVPAPTPGRIAAPAPADPELRSGCFTTSDGVELHYLEAGSGPALVFVPGWTIPAEIWEPQLRHFAANHRVVAVDPRSQGRSRQAAEGHYPVRRAQDLLELVQHLEAAPAVLVGWSLAVVEVLTLAREFGTDALRAAVLVDGFIGQDAEPGAPNPLAPTLTRMQLDRPGFTRAFVRSMYRTPRPDDYLEAITQAALATPTSTAVTLLANLMIMGPGDWRPHLADLDRPVLYVATAQLAAQAEMVRRRRPDARVEVFEDAGHALFVDEADRFNRLLEEFLAGLP